MLMSERSRDDYPAEWTTHGLAVLCGAGVSIPEPSHVPSWWGFNDTVLRTIRDGYVSGCTVPGSAAPAVAQLDLSGLDIAEFSQLVHNAFAGAQWFPLLRALDADCPNPLHEAHGALASQGVLRTIATTNFDTLIEKALGDAAVVLHPLVDAATGNEGRLTVLKLHGSATAAATLIDLADQKRRGLPPEWLDRLESEFSNHSLLVLGFSGADLEFREDYLRLRAASARVPWLRWNVRSLGDVPAAVREVVEACGDRGDFLVGDLPGVLEKFSIPINAPQAAPHRRPYDLSQVVRDWLEDLDGCSPLVCGVVVARVLHLSGLVEEARAVTDGLRVEARSQLASGVNPSTAAQLSLVLGQVASDEMNRHPRRAIDDLDLAYRAYEAVVEHVRLRDGELSEASTIERANNHSATFQNRAYAHLHLRQHRAAERWNEAAREYVAISSVRTLRESSAAEIEGAIAYCRGDEETARTRWDDAIRLAGEAGNGHRPPVVLTNLRRLRGQPRNGLAAGESVGEASSSHVGER